MVIASINDMFDSTMHAVTQCLLTPVLIILSLFFIYALINMGILLAEYYKRRKHEFEIKQFMGQILAAKDRKNDDEIIKIIDAGKIPERHKEVLKTLAGSSNVSNDFRESLAIKMVEDEGLWASKKLERTDIIAKISPAIGLMGTLIPLGPGLTALGSGDIQSLAQHLLIAFDAAVLGMAAAAVAFITSKIRRRWYEEEISNLETMVDTILEIS